MLAAWPVCPQPDSGIVFIMHMLDATILKWSADFIFPFYCSSSASFVTSPQNCLFFMGSHCDQYLNYLNIIERFQAEATRMAKIATNVAHLMTCDWLLGIAVAITFARGQKLILLRWLVWFLYAWMPFTNKSKRQKLCCAHFIGCSIITKCILLIPHPHKSVANVKWRGRI